MFTGIVECTGEVIATEADDDGRRVRVTADLDDLHRGQSIAINGACLTVEDYGEGVAPGDTGETGDDDRWFELFLSRETIERTYLGDLDAGDPVNVERALPAEGRLDGHIVQGHVDATADVTAIERVGDDWEFRFSVPAGLERYVVEKGSVTIDGISLTVADLASGDANGGEPDFGVAIIPETYDVTALSEKAVGDPVHIEVDVVAKYVESMLSADADTQSPYADRFE